MDEQATPRFDPLQHGLYKHIAHGDEIDHHKWMRTCAEGGFVGTCRACGEHLRPLTPHEAGVTTWYEAECLACHKPFAAPAHRHEGGGRVLRRSSRHSEMPGGWWERREDRLKGGGIR